MDTSKIYTPVVIALVAGLIIGFVAGRSSGESNSIESNTEQQKESIVFDHTKEVVTKDVQKQEGEYISVQDQVAGETVDIASVKVSLDGWLAVREVVGGQMGNILGAVRLSTGSYQDVTVDLLRPTISENEYSVVIYRDNGDKEFDQNFDSLVIDGNDPVSSLFKTVE